MAKFVPLGLRTDWPAPKPDPTIIDVTPSRPAGDPPSQPTVAPQATAAPPPPKPKAESTEPNIPSWAFFKAAPEDMENPE